MSTTVTYYPERESRNASRTFLLFNGKVTLNKGDNQVDDELVAEFIKSETVQELIELEVLKVNGKPDQGKTNTTVSKTVSKPSQVKPSLNIDDDDE